MNFESLVGRINLIQDALQAQAAHAVNLSLTARNWLVGYYIVEFEQHGEDRAKYGDKLLKNLAKSLNRKGLGERRLYEYRLTYQIYPQLGSVVADYVFKNGHEEILRLPSAPLNQHHTRCWFLFSNFEAFVLENRSCCKIILHSSLFILHFFVSLQSTKATMTDVKETRIY